MSGWIGVDLDGTLSDHYWPEKGQYDHTRIGDPIMPMVYRIRTWREKRIEVRIMTARVSTNILTCFCHGDPNHVATARIAIEDWCRMHIGFSLNATAQKDYQMMQLWDDRAIRVQYNTGMPCDGCGLHNIFTIPQ